MKKKGDLSAVYSALADSYLPQAGDNAPEADKGQEGAAGAATGASPAGDPPEKAEVNRQETAAAEDVKEPEAAGQDPEKEKAAEVPSSTEGDPAKDPDGGKKSRKRKKKDPEPPQKIKVNFVTDPETKTTLRALSILRGQDMSETITELIQNAGKRADREKLEAIKSALKLRA